MADEKFSIKLRDGSLIILPEGTRKWSELPNADVTTYSCLDGDRIEVNRRTGRVTNITRCIELGELPFGETQ